MCTAGELPAFEIAVVLFCSKSCWYSLEKIIVSWVKPFSNLKREIDSVMDEMESGGKMEGGEKKSSPERGWRVISPLKRIPSQSGGVRLFSPVDSDQELNDLEVENAFGDGVEPDTNQSLISPNKAKRYETPGKLNISPFRPSTVMTNLHRGNVQTTTPSIVEHMSIHQMCAQGELVMLQQEIHEGSEVNKTDELGLTALHWACANGQMPTVEFLVQSGADINLSGNHGENALLLSSCYGYKEIVKYLLKLGMDVNFADESGSSALMYAAYNNHPACISTLLEFGADMTATNEDMMTAYDLSVGQDHKLAQHAIEKHMLSLFEPT